MILQILQQAEERNVALIREKSALQALFSEQDYEVDKSIKKLQAQISQTVVDSKIITQQLRRIQELETEHENLQNKVRIFLQLLFVIIISGKAAVVLFLLTYIIIIVTIVMNILIRYVYYFFFVISSFTNFNTI